MLFNSKRSLWLLVVFVMLITNQAFGHGMSEAEKQAILDGGNLGYMWIGATHMLTGYDHLAFVFGIIFFLTKFRDIVKYITSFTVGHSITLIIATFNAVQANYFLIDAIVALSVCYIAFHNLDGFHKYLKVNPPNMLAMIFGLGLIHGLGLSTRLQELPLNADQLLMNIISFNIGIELGQITALALMLLLIASFRKRQAFPALSKISNVFLILGGAFLFLIQMHGYEHKANVGERVASTNTTHNLVKYQDTITVTIPARGSKEYKLPIEKGATLEYSWKTDKGKLLFDLHAEPKGDTTGYFKSFKKGTASESSGSLTAVFEGPHGWYWKNSGSGDVRVTLKTKKPTQKSIAGNNISTEKSKLSPADIDLMISNWQKRNKGPVVAPAEFTQAKFDSMIADWLKRREEQQGKAQGHGHDH